MNEQAFVDKRTSDWHRLEMLCNRAESSPAVLSPSELKEMVRLYRKISTDLALARTKSTNLHLIEHLNVLAGRSYGLLYREPRKPFWAAIAKATALSAQTVRRNQWFVLSSLFLLLGSAVFSFFLMKFFPDTRDHFIPAGFKEVFDKWKSGQFPNTNASEAMFMTAMYMSHNPFVAIISGAVAAGSFGILTFFLIAQNGALLGALLNYVEPAGKMDFVLSSVAPHGVPELSGIVIAGAAGFRMGYALINPGRHSRGESLRLAGKDGITLLATAVVLMFIAAPIEGFFSFNPIVPGWLKTTVAVVSLTAWLIFWTQFGREGAEDQPS